VIPQHIQELMNAAAGPTGTQSAEPFTLQPALATDLTSTPLGTLQTCTTCKRPRDNSHQTTCPICLRYPILAT
jgi:hypothetical protein